MRENPFPGMNPYLEDPNHWQGVHTRLIAAIDSELSAVLPDEYITRVEERIYIEGWEETDRFFKPDNSVVQIAPSPDERKGGVTTLERPTTDALNTPMTLEWTPRTARQRFVAIYNYRPDEELVAVIEVLSPTNKEFGLGRDDYQRKQRAVFGSTAHLIEVDLLRAGQRTIPPDDAAQFIPPPPCDYLISLHKAGAGNRVDYWPIELRNRLPRIGLPLADDKTVAPLDMQAVVNRTHTDGGIAKSLIRFYPAPPSPPLRADDEKWTDALLREKGLRP